MKRPQHLGSDDFPDNEWVPDGYDQTQVPKATDRNFQALLKHHNNLVDVVNALVEEHGIGGNCGFDEDYPEPTGGW